jgi:hypothetical protein
LQLCCGRFAHPFCDECEKYENKIQLNHTEKIGLVYLVFQFAPWVETN